jgi:hypothetical protein
VLTADFLLTIASHGPDDGILLAGHTVCGAVNVVLRTGDVVLGFAGGVLFAA